MHLRFTTAGESHGKAFVAVVEGLPAGLPVTAEAVDRDARIAGGDADRQSGLG